MSDFNTWHLLSDCSQVCYAVADVDVDPRENCLQPGSDTCPAYRVDDQLRVPRGAQRAVGALMLTTPSGSDRHYTMDFAQFCLKYRSDPLFTQWLKQTHDDIVNLATGDNWKGQGPFPMGCVISMTLPTFMPFACRLQPCLLQLTAESSSKLLMHHAFVTTSNCAAVVLGVRRIMHLC